MKFAETHHQLNILFGILRKAEARIQHDAIPCDPRDRCDFERALQEEKLVGDHVGKLLPFAARVHQAQSCAGISSDLSDLRLLLQSEYVIDNMRSRADRKPGGLGPIGVDRDQRIGLAAQRLDHRQDSCLLLQGSDDIRAGTCRLAADIDDLSPLLGGLKRVRNSGIDSIVTSAIREGIRRRVDDRHNNGACAQFYLTAMPDAPETAPKLCQRQFILSIEKGANHIALAVPMPQAPPNFNMSICRMLSVPRYMPFVLGFSMVVPACPPASAAVIATKSYSYFAIGGKTADQLDQQLSSNGPTASGSSARHPGATKIRFGGDATYVQTGGKCKVGNAKVTVHTQIILPRWTNRKGASKQLSMVWDALSSDIKRHEERHAEIARNQARVMERQILALPPQPNCERMQELVTDVSTRGIEEHDRLQARFDRVEAANFENRMMRLLDHRLKKSGGAR